jgi:hypothetical protein
VFSGGQCRDEERAMESSAVVGLRCPEADGREVVVVVEDGAEVWRAWLAGCRS